MSIRPFHDRQSHESSQRRHLTVMFCDVVGATRLSDKRDVESYFSILHAYYEACRPVVERHGGLIAQHQGDGIYVWFGYPLPRDDDTVRAVRAGLDLLVALRKLSESLEGEIGEPLVVRIAVHAGEALVAPIAGEPSPLAFGHTPNLAAKLQQAADPGTLVVSSAALRLIRDCFEVTIRSPATLADGSQVSVYQVVKERQREGRVGRDWRTPIVDRERERAHLQEVWSSVQAGRGAAVALVGGRGIGKTRLASTALTLARSTQANALDCACNHLEASTAYRPFRTLLAQAASIEADDPPMAAAALLRAHLLDTLDMDALAPTLFATLLGLPPAVVGPTPDLDPAKLAEITTHLLVEWLTRLAAATPTVILVDDVADADPSSLTVLAQLSTALPPRLLLVFTARSDVPPPPFLASDTIELIEVTPLPDDVCATLIDTVTAESPLTLQDRQRVLAQGEGIPLFLEELARATQEGLNRASLPITLTGHLQARLAAPGIDREVAGVLAVAGHDLDASVLAAVLGENPATLQERLDGLLTRDLVVHTTGTGSSYRFRHGLITEAAYSLLLRDHRTQLHDSLAEALTARQESGYPVDWNVVGKHLKLAGRPLDAYEAILTGADEACRTGAFREALQGYRNALDIIEEIAHPGTRAPLEFRCRLQRSITVVSAYGFGADEAVEDFGRCAELARELGPRPENLTLLNARFTFHLTRGELSTARKLAENLRSWVDSGHVYYRAESTSTFGWVSFYEGNYEQAYVSLRLAVDQFTSRSHNDYAGQNWLYPYDPFVGTLCFLGSACWITGRSREGQEALQQALARAKTLVFPEGPFSVAYATIFLAWISALQGQHETAVQLASEVRDIGRRHGFAFWESAGEIHLTIAQYRISGRRDAAETIEQLAGVWEPLGGRVFLPYVLTMAADIRAAMGQHDKAAVGFNAAGQLAQHDGVSFYEAERLRLSALALPVPAQESLALLRRAWDLANQHGALLFELRAALELTRLTEDPQWATRLATAIQRLASPTDYPEVEQGRALLARVQL